jgi:hypothetical protein
MDLLMRLEGEARRAGGRVDVLMGNHEAMNILRDVRDVGREAYATFADRRSEDRRRRAFDAHAGLAKRAGAALDREAWFEAHPPGYVEYAEAMGPGGRYGRWIRDRQAMLQIDDVIFMHAGLPPASTATLDDVNRTVEREVRAWDAIVRVLRAHRLIEPAFTLQEVVNAAQAEIGRIVLAQREGKEVGGHVTPELIAVLKQIPDVPRWSIVDADGPLWYRGLALMPDTEAPGVASLLTRLGARRFVTGHTPQLPEARIGRRFGDRVLVIDTGMLVSHYKGRPSALEIAGDALTAIYPDGRVELR